MTGECEWKLAAAAVILSGLVQRKDVNLDKKIIRKREVERALELADMLMIKISPPRLDEGPSVTQAVEQPGSEP